MSHAQSPRTHQISVNIDTPLRVLLAQRTSFSSTAAAAAAVQTCTPNDTLLSVVRKFSSSRVLRLVCVEHAGSSKIVGLVSLTDLFKCASELIMLLQQCCRH
jgi:CBS-domain-containing membrane protein